MSDDGSGAPGGEERADKEFFGDQRANPCGQFCRGVDAGEVRERRGRDYGVRFTDGERHEAKSKRGGDGCGTNGDGGEGVAIAPVEEVAIAQIVEHMGADCAASVEQAIADVDGPGAAAEQQRNPWFEMNAGSPGKCERPHDSDGGSIEAGEVP